MYYNTHELVSLNLEAWKALPEPYREDDCLCFTLTPWGDLFCEPKADDLGILGDWECMYNPETQTWDQVN